MDDALTRSSSSSRFLRKRRKLNSPPALPSDTSPCTVCFLARLRSPFERSCERSSYSSKAIISSDIASKANLGPTRFNASSISSSRPPRLLLLPSDPVVDHLESLLGLIGGHLHIETRKGKIVSRSREEKRDRSTITHRWQKRELTMCPAPSTVKSAQSNKVRPRQHEVKTNGDVATLTHKSTLWPISSAQQPCHRRANPEASDC